MKKLLLFFVFLFVCSNVYAAIPTDKSIKRITHPNYKGQTFVGQPWVHFNQDNTLLILYENSSLVNQNAGVGLITGEAVADTTNPIEGTLAMLAVLNGTVTFTDSSATPQVARDNNAGAFKDDVVGYPPTANGSIDYNTGVYSFSFKNTPVAPITVSYSSVGRGFVWGTIENWKTWSDFDDYKSKIVPVPAPAGESPPAAVKSNIARSYDIVWSNVTGEEDIAYWIDKDGTSLDVIRSDCTANTAEVWVTIPDTGDGLGGPTDFTKIDNAGSTASLFGWISEGLMMINVPHEQNTSGYIAVDVVSKTKTNVDKDGEGETAHPTGYPNGDITNYPNSSCGNNDYQCTGGSPTIRCQDKYEAPEFRELPMNTLGHGHWVQSLSNNYYVDRCCTKSQSYTCVYEVLPSLRKSAYKWTISGSGTNEYYCEVTAGGSTGLSEPHAMFANNVELTEGAVGSLIAGGWDWGDNDSLGFNTYYVRLSDGTDPDSKTEGYVRYERDLESGSVDPIAWWQQRLLFDSGSWSNGSTHFSWFNTDDTWFMGGGSAGTFQTNPNLVNGLKIFLYAWDGTTVTPTVLTTVNTAGSWDYDGGQCGTNDDTCEDNGSVQPRVIGSHDGTMAIYTMTDGKYSIEDKLKNAYHDADAAVNANWEMGGVWLITFDPPPVGVRDSMGSFSGSGNFR